MPRSQYGVPLDLYADDEELDPLKGSPLEPEAQFDLPELKRMQYAALDELSAPPSDELEPVALPATPATGGSGPVIERAPQPRPPPRGYGAGLGGADLDKAQKGDAFRRAMDDTGGALYATFARKPMPKQEGTSDAANLVQRRAGVDQEEQLVDRQNTRQAKLAQEAEWRNPASDGNVAMREALKGTGLAPDLVNSPQFERMTKPHLEAVYGKDFVGKLMLMANRAKAAKAPKAPKNSPESLAAFRAAAIKSHPKLDPQLVNSLDSVDDINKLMTDERAAESADASITAARVGAGREQGRYERDLADKERRDRESVEVPGTSIRPGAHPTSDDAKKVKVNLLAREKISRYVAEMRAIHKRVGTELFGKDAERMDQLRESTLIEAKNAADLGALSGPDMGIVTRLMGVSPTSFEAKGKALLGNDNTQANLDGMDSWLETGADSTLKVLGYARGGRTAASGPQPGGAVQMKFPDGSVHPVDAADIEAARRKGGVPQ